MGGVMPLFTFILTQISHLSLPSQVEARGLGLKGGESNDRDGYDLRPFDRHRPGSLLSMGQKGS